MKKQILLLSFVIISYSVVFSQGCLPEGITFTTQEQIDSFQINYPGCTEIEGDVHIGIQSGVTDINNLNGLNVLTGIGGCLIIHYNNVLTSISGFQNLIFVGDYLWIRNNAMLNSLNGLESLVSIGGDLWIVNNDALTSLSALESLTSVEGLTIFYNDHLTSLSGFENLKTIDNIHLWANYSLNNLSGLENLTTINEYLIIEGNPLTSLSGLESLTSIGGYLDIRYSHLLSNLSGLEGLTSIGGYLRIFYDQGLSSLSGLENIDPNSISSLKIYFNPLLSQCDVLSICDYLASPNGTIIIHDNAPGCNSPEEIEAACLTSIEDNIAKEEISLFPNPASDYITINVNEGQPIEQAIIYNHLGQKALVAVPVNNTVDVSKLKPGIYFLEVATKESRIRQKLMIE